MAGRIKGSPCLGCEDRHPCCHSECADYKAYRKMIDDSKASRKGLIMAGTFLHENAVRMNDALKKHHWK